jgi:hypothetical protein
LKLCPFASDESKMTNIHASYIRDCAKIRSSFMKAFSILIYVYEIEKVTTVEHFAGKQLTECLDVLFLQLRA